ncbi:MAG: EscU/YscU/HrcU family type III secretion system export apparatus switch protein [Thermodesulfobacteriaceae bacterium]|nr:EscU/YscU/HrcU family type III secretion system export apparatus switch protein [Thermodesulfobacteriaceae bacterium]
MNEKEKIAVALKYEPEKGAPEVIAKGKGYLAELILKIAKEHNLPIKEDSHLVQELYKLELNKPIPRELYHAVAVVLAWAYKVNEKVKEKVLQEIKKGGAL